MNYFTGEAKILEKEQLSKTVWSFTVAYDGPQASPGQFVQIKAKGFYLRRPISICDASADTLRLVIEVRGEGTAEISKLDIGEGMDIIAPLGKGFTLLDKEKKAVFAGGGIGTPPLLFAANHYGKNAKVFLGFRSGDAVILKRDFEEAGAGVTICTDDGTRGEKGFVTDALLRYLENNTTDIIYACGPKVMLKKVAAIAEQHGICCEVSLEERMGCGVGACLCCACKAVKDGKEFMAHVCKDGPVFSGKEVVFEP